MSRERQGAIREFLRVAKSFPCRDCGDSHPPEVMHFHHAFGTKRFTVSKIHQYGLKSIRAEIAKCTLLCANCHTKRHITVS